MRVTDVHGRKNNVGMRKNIRASRRSSAATKMEGGTHPSISIDTFYL